MSDLTLGFLPSATLVGGHLNGSEQSSSMPLRLFLEPTGFRGLFLTFTDGLLEATGGLLVTAGLLVANGASNSSTSPRKVGSSSSTGRMAFAKPLLGVDLGASSSVTAEPGLEGLLSGTLPRFLCLPLSRSSALTLGLPPAGREGNRCLPGGETGLAAGCTGSSGTPTSLSKKGGVSMSAGKSMVREKSLPPRGGDGVEAKEEEGLKVAAFPGLKSADD